MGGIAIPSWTMVLALFIAFGCGTLAYYRLHHDHTTRARLVLAFTSLAFAVLVFYAVQINPYPQPPAVQQIFTGLALLLLMAGIILILLNRKRTGRRLSLAEVRALLPKGLRELKPEQMRELLPPRFHRHSLHEIQALVMAQLSDMSPEVLRTLSPEKLQAALRSSIPRSILDQK